MSSKQSQRLQSKPDLSTEPRQISEALPAFVIDSLPDAVRRRFELIRRLGEGAGGSVYLCRDRENHSPLRALKVLTQLDAGDDIHLDRFYDEGKAALSIDSINVVRCYDILMADEFFAYTMEFIEGENLAQRLEKGAIQSIQHAQKMLLQIANGLADIHSFGIVHRDIKPTNILISKSGRVCITDLGVARIPCCNLQQQELQISDAKPNTASHFDSLINRKERLTSRGGIIGTLDYLSPEYIEHGVLDFRCDVYAFGIIAFQILTGMLPFLGTHPYARLLERVSKAAPSVQILNPQCNIKLSQLIASTLARNPALRPESGQALVNELLNCIE